MNINGIPQNPIFQSVAAPVIGNINGAPGISTFTGNPTAPYIYTFDYSIFGAGGITVVCQSGQQFTVSAVTTGGSTMTSSTSDPVSQGRVAVQNNGSIVNGKAVRAILAANGQDLTSTDWGLTRQGKVTLIADQPGLSGFLIGTSAAAPIFLGVNSIEVARFELSGGLSLGRNSLTTNYLGSSGIVLNNLVGRTYTDKFSTGTNSIATIVSFTPATITATSGAGYNDVATLYINGVPSMGANTTGTNRWALFSSGDTRVDGNITLGKTSATTGTKIGYAQNYIQFNSGNGNLLYQNLNPAYPKSNVTGNFSVTGGQFRYVWTGSAVGTGTLPAASLYSGMDFLIKNISSSSALTLSGNIDYGVNYSITSMSAARLWSDNVSWLLI